MPTTRPIVELPEAFRPLTALLEEMPIVKADGTPGLLAEYKLGARIGMHLSMKPIRLPVPVVNAADHHLYILQVSRPR